MMHYRDWTAAQVRDVIIEAAHTVSLLPDDWRPKKETNALPETVREQWKDQANEVRYRRRASAGEISRMEMAWGWINSLDHEPERRLLYEWTEAKALGKGYLARVMARNELTERTMRRAVTRVCQRIADSLNRKHEIRLTVGVDEMSVISEISRADKVAVKKCAPPKTPRAQRSFEHLEHDRSKAGHDQFAKHLAAVNRRRKNEAMRKAQRDAKKRKQREAA